MKAWWYGRSEREQRLLLAAGAVLLLGLFWWGIWQPQQQSLEQARASVVAQQDLYQWMQEQAQTLIQQQGGQQARPVFTGSMSQLASSSSKRYGVRISRLQPESSGQLQLFLDDVEFNQLLAWLGYLQGRGVEVHAIDLIATEAPGTVRIRRLILRSNP